MRLEELIREVLLIAGFAAFAVGLWMVHPALSLTACGALLMWATYPRRAR